MSIRYVLGVYSQNIYLAYEIFQVQTHFPAKKDVDMYFVPRSEAL